MQMEPRIMGHFSPQQLRNRPNAKGPLYEEVVIPSRMAAFSDGLRFPSDLLNPNHDMTNAISLELARSRSKFPAYAPFIYPRIDEPPWPMSTNEHAAAIAKWGSNTRLSKREASPPRCSDPCVDLVSGAFSDYG